MTVLALGLVVIAATIHATWNLLAKRAAPVGPTFVFAYNLFSFAAYAPWVGWVLWQGTMHWSWPVAACIAASGVIHLAYSLALQRGYQVADLSVVYPVARGTGPLIASIGAFALIGERPTPSGLLGLAAVVGGIIMIATRGKIGIFRQPGATDGVRWGFGTGVLIASYTVVDGYGVKALLITPVVLDWCANAFRFAMLTPLVARDPSAARARMRGYWGIAAAVGLLSPLGYILVLTALRMGAPLSLVAPARELSMMIGALLGMAILREPVDRWRIGGCVLLTMGVVLLGVG